MSDVTRLLELVGTGDTGAEDLLLSLVHDELKRIAAYKLASERPGHTLQTTALVNEAYIRLLGKKHEGKKHKSRPTATQNQIENEIDESAQKPIHWDSRGHFFAAAAEAMRRILIDNARRKKRQKRGGNNKQVPVEEAEFAIETPSVDLELLDQALTKLESQSPEHAALVKLRYFAGMTIEQTAEVLDVSPATVKRGWNFSRAWLRREMGD